MLFISLVWGCGGSDKKREEDNASTNTSRASELLGVWESTSKCIRYTLERNGIYYGYIQHTIQISDTKYSSYMLNYRDSTCTERERVSLKIEYKYRIGSEVMSSSGVMANQIELSDGKQFYLYDDQSDQVLVWEVNSVHSKIFYIDNDTLYFGTDIDDPDSPAEIDFESAFERFD